MKLNIVLASFALMSTPAFAAPLLSDTGFSGTATTIDFSSPGLAAGTVASNQFAGVTFSATNGSVFYSSGDPGIYSGGLTGFAGTYLDNFTGGFTTNTSSVYTIAFASLVNRAGAYFESNFGAPAITLSAFSGATLVDSFIYNNPSCCSSSAFLGFSDIAFDSIQLSNITGNDFIMDTLRFDGAVPEPASWAMLITGFGLTGAAMRRRRAVVVA